MKEYLTLAELTASTQEKTGLMLYCRENLYYYILQDTGYTATGDDVTLANGRVAKAVYIADAKYIKTTAGNVQDALDSILGLTKVSSTTDTNSGRVMTVGYLGIGTNAITLTDWNSDLSSFRVFYAPNGTPNAPVAGAINWTGVRLNGANANNGMEIFGGDSAKGVEIWARLESAGAYSNAVEFVHSGNRHEQKITTLEIINTGVRHSDSSYLDSGSVIETFGFNSLGDGGGGKWKRTGTTGLTASQNPSDTGDGTLVDAFGHEWEIVTNGNIDVLQLGAVSGTTSANDSTDVFAAVSAHCLSTGDSWCAYGDFFADSIDVYTTFTGEATIYTSNNGQSDGVINVLPNPSDVSTGTLSDIQSALPLSRGQTTISGLGAYAGKVVRVATSERYLERSGSGSDYRYDITFMVLNSDGDIHPSIPHDFPNTLTMSVFDTEVARKKISVKGLNVIANTGSTARSKMVSVKRSFVDVSMHAENDTSTEVYSMFVAELNSYNVNFESCTTRGAKVSATNYGFSLAGSTHSLIACSESDCRRGVDGFYVNDVTIVGGSYPDGIGAHLGFDYKVNGVSYIGYSSANENPLHFTGGDVSVSASKIVTKTGSIFRTRTDAPEVIGKVSLTDSTIIFDWSSETGTPTGAIVEHRYPATVTDLGRETALFDNVVIRDNEVVVKGTSHTGNMDVFTAFNKTPINNLSVSTTVNVSGNSYKFENGTSQRRYSASTNDSLTGDKLVIIDNDYATIGQAYFANTESDYDAPHLYFYARNTDSATVRYDFGWVIEAEVRNATFSAATGTPADDGNTDLIDAKWV